MMIKNLRFQYFSDIHLEFIKPYELEKFLNKIVPKEPLCILAGDIGNPYSDNYKSFIKDVHKKFEKIFLIAGNHEYYSHGKSIDETNEYIVSICSKYSNISFLNNNYELYEGYNFVGSILWSKIKNTKYEINDTEFIKDMNISKYNILNEKCLAYLESALDKLDNVIVITHHMPSSTLIDSKYKVGSISNYNEWFYCDMDEFICKNKDKIKCWIYGHTHTPSEKLIENVNCICNPIGYPNENSRIDLEKVWVGKVL